MTHSWCIPGLIPKEPWPVGVRLVKNPPAVVFPSRLSNSQTRGGSWCCHQVGTLGPHLSVLLRGGPNEWEQCRSCNVSCCYTRGGNGSFWCQCLVQYQSEVRCFCNAHPLYKRNIETKPMHVFCNNDVLRSVTVCIYGSLLRLTLIQISS